MMTNNSPGLVQSPGLVWTLDIPEDWKNIRLKFIAKRVVVGIAEAETQAYADEEIPIIRSTNLRANRLNSNDLRFINHDFAWKNRSKFIQALDLLTVRTCNAGVTAVVPQELDQCQCFTMLITTLKQGQNPYFYSYFLNSIPAQQYFQAESWGTAQENISVPILKEIPIPNPCKGDQDKIATFLDRKTAAIDTLIAKKQRLIELLEEKRAALINQAVTKGLNPDVPMKDSGIPWIGEIPEHWKVKRLKYVCDLETGHTPRKSEESYWEDEECTIPWVSLNDTKTLEKSDYIDDTKIKISEYGMANSSAHLIEAGAVVFNRDGARVGLAAITTKPMAVSQHIIAWVCKPEILNTFVLHVMYAMKEELYRLTAGSTIPTIGMSDVKEMVTPVPPIEEQRAIMNLLLRRK